MQFSLQEKSPLERHLSVQVPRQQVEQEIEKKTQELAQQAKINGFRPGKVPLRVIRRSYGPQIENEVVQSIMQNSLRQIIKEENLDLVQPDGLKAEKVDMNSTQLHYEVHFEVYPPFDPENLSELELTAPNITHSDDDITWMLQRIARENPIWTAIERPAAGGDRLLLQRQDDDSRDFSLTLPDTATADHHLFSLYGQSRGECCEISGPPTKEDAEPQRIMVTIKQVQQASSAWPDQLQQLPAVLGMGKEADEKNLRDYAQRLLHGMVEDQRHQMLEKALLSALIAQQPLPVLPSLLRQAKEAANKDAASSKEVTATASEQDPSGKTTAAVSAQKRPDEDSPTLQQLSPPQQQQVQQQMALSLLLRHFPARIDEQALREEVKRQANRHPVPEQAESFYANNESMLRHIAWLLQRRTAIEQTLSKIQCKEDEHTLSARDFLENAEKTASSNT